MANLVWVRDAMQDSTDWGTGNARIYDLLWKARSGDSQGTSPPAGELQADLTYAPGQKTVQPRALAGGLPDLDIQGARIKRVIMEYGVYFAPLPGTLPTERNDLLAQGVYEALTVLPSQVQAGGLGSATSIILPGNSKASVAHDWMWWNRRYAAMEGWRQRSSPTPIIPITESIFYASIDTRNSRTLSEWGSSLYFILEPAGASGIGDTINGCVASWSVLLELPA